MESVELEGRLVQPEDGRLVLLVPNAIVLGVYKAIVSPGVSLPLVRGRLNACVEVMSDAEVSQVGGVINDRGKSFKFRLGSLQSEATSEWSKEFFFNVSSPSLATLRRSYGLGNVEFKILCAVRKRKVLYDNEVTKVAMSSLCR